MKVLMQIEGVTRLDWMRNENIKERLRQESVLDAVKRRQERWRVSLENMRSERLTKTMFTQVLNPFAKMVQLNTLC